MTLQFLPFRSNDRVGKAATNAPPMKQGERGTAVHILQQALVDFGLPMPISMAKGGPDGIFGNETRKTVASFQDKKDLVIDGIAGRQTFNALDDAMTNGPKAQRPRRVTLHFRSLALTTVPFESQFGATQKVCGQYNIDMVFGSGSSMGLAEQKARKFEKIDGQC